MTKLNKLILIVSILFATSFGFAATESSTAKISASATYASRFIDEGVKIGDATLIGNVKASFESFSVGVTSYNPTTISTKNFDSQLSRVDVTGGYTFFSTLVDATAGVTYKHYNHVSKTGQADTYEPFVRLNSKGLPLYILSRYNIATRNVNLEGGFQGTLPSVAGFEVTPSVYIGYNDTNDNFPHSVKEIKTNNRYYGGGVVLSRKALGGEISVGGFLHRTDHALTVNDAYWTAGYGFKF